MRTFCFGRFLIDLPQEAVVKAGYTFARNKVTTIRDVDDKQFADMVRARKSMLSMKPHRGGGTTLVRSTELDDRSVLLTSWSSETSQLIHRQDLYVFLPEHRVAYHFQGESDEQQLDRAIEYYGSLRRSVQFRRTNEVPQRPGFCIDSGLITRSKLNTEEFSVGVRMASHPGAAFTLTSYVTGKPDADLLSRASSLPAEYQQVDARMVKLRRGERRIGPIRGQEILGRAQQDATRAYAFLWESQGESKSLAAPFLSLEMTTDKRAPQETPPFQGDEDALAFWDRLLDSLRLRPGAI